ncbi:Proton-coupled amino acid transporter 4, partial [Operophtera brumata]
MGIFKIDLSVHFYLVLLFPLILALAMVKNLKYLTPVSLLASIMTAWGLVITFYYILQDLPNTNTILPLENNMKTPEAFGGWNGVLNTGMVIVGALYTAIGFFGYLKLAQSVRTVMAAAIFLSYGLQFYVPMGIVWPFVKSRLSTIFLSYGLQSYVPMGIVWPFVKSRLSSEDALKHGEAVTRVVLILITCKYHIPVVRPAVLRAHGHSVALRQVQAVVGGRLKTWGGCHKSSTHSDHIFLSYGLQSYVPMGIVWPFVKSRLSSEDALKHGEAITRVYSF